MNLKPNLWRLYVLLAGEKENGAVSNEEMLSEMIWSGSFYEGSWVSGVGGLEGG